MALYLLDTNAFSAVMDEDPRVLAHADSLPPSDRLVVCTIVRGEVLFGLAHMPQGRKRREFEAKAAELFTRIACLGLPRRVADFYAEIKNDVQQRGVPLDENDLWIAATARSLDAVLVTADTDFQRVSGLRTEDWTR